MMQERAKRLSPLSRRHAIRLALGSAAFSSLAGCARGERESPASRQSSLNVPFVNLALDIKGDWQGPPIREAYAGFSYEKNHIRNNFFADRNHTLVRLCNNLGPSILRIGGNSVDEMVWQSDYPSGQPNAVTAADVDALAGFLAATGWRIIYGINLAQNTPARAAQEAAYVSRVLGRRLYAFEIGNEPDAYSINGHRPPSYTYKDFLLEWQLYAEAIQQAAPAALLSGPASAWHESTWTEPFAQDEARRISLLTQHYYRANGLSPQSTIAFLLAGDPALPDLLTGLRDASTRARIPLGYRLTEANSFYDGGAPHISNTYGGALWALDFMLMTASYGASGVNLHGGGSDPGYTPIADDGRHVIEVRPEYYAMLMFNLVAHGKLIHAAQSLADRPVSSYAVAADGRRQVLIINKEPSTGVNISLSGNYTFGEAEIFILSAPALNSIEGITLNGASVGQDGGWSPAPPVIKKAAQSLDLRIRPASAVLVTFT